MGVAVVPETRRIRLAVAAGLILALTQLPPAEATLTAYKCAIDGCKYAKARVDYTVNSPNSSTVNRIDVRGATASGSCDPTNDVTNWRVNAATVRNSSNTIIWSTGSSAYKTNCDVNASGALFTYYPGVSASSPRSVITWRHNTGCCGPFYPTVTIYS